jgi:aminomethyltransferase
LVTQQLKRTPLNPVHHRLKARMMDFAGWDLPAWYSSILDEHAAVRTDRGIFDVSDMGRVLISGQDSTDYLNKMLTRNVKRLTLGASMLCLLCLENGGILDDLLLYRTGKQRYLIVWNASDVEFKLEWLYRWLSPGLDVKIEDISGTTAMVAIQGPNVGKMALLDMAVGLPRFGYLETQIAGMKVVLTRTGYTGEDGFEMITDAKDAIPIWDIFMGCGVKPCGLGCRDTLRLEAGMMLSGQDMDQGTNPYEADLGWLVDLAAGGFVGREALLKIMQTGISRKLVGFQMNGRIIARAGYPVVQEGNVIGKVTSGGPSPSLGKNIGFCYVPMEISGIGTEINILVRHLPVPATVVGRRFYKKRS